ncbi:MAG: lipoyl synthase [Bacteroidetes bacterium]|nr:lipoyl synthase [Bacteroidota bacterium]
MEFKRKPEWLKIRLSKGDDYLKVKEIVKQHHVHTICESGDCPNLGECWSRGTATFMILGNICTRNCRFCNVTTGKPLLPDVNEPLNIASSIKLMNIKHCVITSVDRDDLPDFGAQHWADTILKIKELNPSTTIEVLIPDFQGNTNSLQKVMDAKPDIISHNLETVERLTPEIRSKAKYRLSLDVLKYIAEGNITPKSGIMLGLGEKENEILQTMDDLLAIGCKIITIGQYLQPTRQNISVEEYITPEKFEFYRQKAIENGFEFAESAPLVRSSYHAERQIQR